jgi:hypothetical protein
MQLMHAAFTGGQAILGSALAPANYLVWYGAFTALLWLLAAIAALTAQRIPRPQRSYQSR